jgi:hypothetical protein
MRYRFIEAEKASYPVALMCRILQVSRGGYYAWRTRPESARSRSDRTLLVAIRAAHKASRRTYGSPRMQRELLWKSCLWRHRPIDAMGNCATIWRVREHPLDPTTCSSRPMPFQKILP